MWVPYASTCTGSSRLADARPVRSPPNSCFSNWIAPCMRRLSSLRSCVGFAMANLTSVGRYRKLPAGVGGGFAPSIADNGGAPLPAQHCGNRSFLADREHDDRHTIFPSKREGGGIHHFQVALDRLARRQTVVAHGFLVLLRVGAIDPIDVGRFEHSLSGD